ncbi:MAG: hypothetical protein ACJ76F_01210 [Bacteroidia bacterium]
MRKLESYNDDTYLDPQRDKNLFYPKEEIKAEPVQPTDSKIAANPADNSNPYYKDKDFNYDDYYDNEYASRVKRFHSPMYGVGYYDTYYTNSYFYNQNPYQYGVSIYNGYNFWPSYNNYSYVSNYNWGGYYGCGSNYNYNPYTGYYGPGYGSGYGYMNSGFGYSNFGNNWCGNNWNNPYGGFGYNPYSMGYGNGFNNGFNSGYYSAYSNHYDHNSSVYYGPRASHSGNNNDHEMLNATGSKMTIQKPLAEDYSSSAPTSMERFNQIKLPENVKSQVMNKGNNNGGGTNTGDFQGRPNNTNFSGTNNSTGVITNGSNGTTRGGTFSNENTTNSPKAPISNGSNSEPKKRWSWASGDSDNSSNPGRPINPNSSGNGGNGGFEHSKGNNGFDGGFGKPSSGGSNQPSNNSSAPRSTSSGGGFRPR